MSNNINFLKLLKSVGRENIILKCVRRHSKTVKPFSNGADHKYNIHGNIMHRLFLIYITVIAKAIIIDNKSLNKWNGNNSFEYFTLFYESL